MSEGFGGFPKLPPPRPLSEGLKVKNPLLAGATVVDRTSGTGGPSAFAAPPAADSSSATRAVVGTSEAAPVPSTSGAEAEEMGGTLGKPVVLSRHQRVAPAARRKKVPFEIGHSQVDWVRLTQSGADLSGLGGGRPRRDITMEEVRKHKTAEDCWTVLRGKVYNLTPYLRFHPGGVAILMSIAGKDGTALFNKYHAWVNAEFMLAKCLVGYLAPQARPASGSDDKPAGASGPSAAEQEQQQPGSSSSSDAAAEEAAQQPQHRQQPAPPKWQEHKL